MSYIGESYKQADWKSEKHVPVIDCPDQVSNEQAFQVNLGVGVEVAHPNTTEHHIRWIRLFYLPEGGGPAFEVANLEFSAHAESVEGPNQGPASTQHRGSIFLKLGKSGTLVATSYCNIHGLWESKKQITVS